ncbi:DNA polymerase III subunit delta [Candidimonas nitroreducens]|uniref:DNA polymerase III subunit delta n=1 Tax=Candidimonas nitroreducens TaxID=683354 RepID=A0A225MB97_9BURK|nr:DNA polymerase III subunit delta [Candidimonas nitroreducens]OWT57420.1 DNA polymerase III subunit delta [Candidimonas nitroreducens]
MGRPADPDSLIASLRQGRKALDPLYVVSGDEPLLVTETMDGLRAAAIAQGYTQRSSMVMDANSDWSAVLAATRNVSLFGDRRLVELKLPGGKPGKSGGETLQRLAEMAGSGQWDGDTLMLVSLPRLDKATRSGKWAGALWQHATTLELASVERAQLPGWIRQRLAQQNQEVDAQVLEWMADKVEGNLLAAFQEIQKLALLYPEGRIEAADVERAVLNVARYDVFGLRDAMLAGQPARTLSMLAGLRAEGTALPLVLWAVGDEIRVLARLAEARAQGRDLGGEMRKGRVFGNHERLARQALARVPPGAWPAAVQHAHEVDRLIKGLKVPGRLDDPWEEMGRLALRVAAVRPAAGRG